MTAEIAILNKTAIALAADSAVTVSAHNKGESKIYFTTDKLFPLTPKAPVAVMVYSSATLMEVPWDVLIDLYRRRLGARTFPHLADYSQDFLNFLSKHAFDKTNEANFIDRIAAAVCRDLRTKIDTEAENVIKSKGSISYKQVRTIVRNTIRTAATESIANAAKSGYNARHKAQVRAAYHQAIASISQTIFGQKPLSKTDNKNLLSAIVNTSLSASIHEFSGVVIAGYGDEDLFPSVCDHHIRKVLLGKVISQQVRHEAIDYKKTASILAFAQSREVATFMEGIGPEVKAFITNQLGVVLKDKLPTELAKALQPKLNLSQADTAALESAAKQVGTGAHDNIVVQLGKISAKHFSGRVVDATEFLPKDELALMAETLVNLESFRKKVTFVSETVGGMTDVALITKAEGFVWVKRKTHLATQSS